MTAAPRLPPPLSLLAPKTKTTPNPPRNFVAFRAQPSPTLRVSFCTCTRAVFFLSPPLALSPPPRARARESAARKAFFSTVSPAHNKTMPRCHPCTYTQRLDTPQKSDLLSEFHGSSLVFCAGGGGSEGLARSIFAAGNTKRESLLLQTRSRRPPSSLTNRDLSYTHNRAPRDPSHAPFRHRPLHRRARARQSEREGGALSFAQQPSTSPRAPNQEPR